MNSETKRVKKNFLEYLVLAIMPVLGMLLVTLADYVMFEYTQPSKSYWIDFVLNTSALMFFFLPFFVIFRDQFMSRQRIVGKQGEYSACSTVVYSHLSQFYLWCDIEFNDRKMRYVERHLQLCKNLTYDEFMNTYKMSPSIVRKDSTLSGPQKRMLIRLIITINWIKPVRPEKVLPGTSAGTEFDRTPTNSRKRMVGTIVNKLAMAFAISYACVSLFSSLDFTQASQNIIPIIIGTGIKVAAGCWQIFSALICAHSFVNHTYFSELSERIMVMSEFIEYKDLKNEYNAIVKNDK